MKKSWKIVAAVVVAGALGVAVFASVAARRTAKAELVSPERGDLTTWVEETGKVRLDRERTVTAVVAGLLGPVLVEEGDTVTGGQVLAAVEDLRFREGLEQARASIRELEARIEGLDAQVPKEAERKGAALAVDRAAKTLEMEERSTGVLETERAQFRREIARLASLSEGGLSPAAELERLKAREDACAQSLATRAAAEEIAALNLDVAREEQKALEARRGDVEHLRKVFAAGIERIRSEMKILEDEKARTVLRAPFAGVVLERMTRGDVVVQPGAPVVRIGDPATLQVEVDLLSDDLPAVAPGRRAVVSGKAIGEIALEGRVAKIHPEAFTKISSLGIEQQRVRVEIRLEALDLALKPGVAVDVKIEARTAAGALLVPETSVFTRSGAPFVFAVRGGTLALVPVKEGLSDDRVVQILEGLEESDRIVRNPRNDMEEGMKVVENGTESRR